MGRAGRDGAFQLWVRGDSSGHNLGKAFGAMVVRLVSESDDAPCPHSRSHSPLRSIPRAVGTPRKAR